MDADIATPPKTSEQLLAIYEDLRRQQHNGASAIATKTAEISALEEAQNILNEQVAAAREALLNNVTTSTQVPA